LHQVGTSSLLIYMMHGHTYIELYIVCTVVSQTQNSLCLHINGSV